MRIALLCAIALCMGCQTLWTTDVKYASLGKTKLTLTDLENKEKLTAEGAELSQQAADVSLKAIQAILDKMQ